MDKFLSNNLGRIIKLKDPNVNTPLIIAESKNVWALEAPQEFSTLKDSIHNPDSTLFPVHDPDDSRSDEYSDSEDSEYSDSEEYSGEFTTDTSTNNLSSDNDECDDALIQDNTIYRTIENHAYVRRDWLGDYNGIVRFNDRGKTIIIDSKCAKLEKKESYMSILMGNMRNIAKYFQGALIKDLPTFAKLIGESWYKKPPSFGIFEPKDKDEGWISKYHLSEAHKSGDLQKCMNMANEIIPGGLAGAIALWNVMPSKEELSEIASMFGINIGVVKENKYGFKLDFIKDNELRNDMHFLLDQIDGVEVLTKLSSYL